MKYIFLGSPEIAVVILKKVCETYGAPLAVVTQTAKATGRGQKIASTAVGQFAREKGLPLIETDRVTAEQLQPYSPDVLLVVAFGQILKSDVLAFPRVAPLNVHASLLPKYRGAAPFQRAIWNHEKKTGITIQKMAKKLDAGDILLQKEIAILPEETSGELLERLATLGAEASIEALRLLDTGKYFFTPQDESLATLAPKIDKSEAIIDWKQPAEKIFDQVRALQPWPVAETTLESTPLKVFRARVSPPEKSLTAGEIHTDHKTFLQVGCGDKSSLFLTEIQLANRKRLAIRDFLLAYRGNFPHSRMGA